MTIAALSLLTACEISTGAGEDGFGYEPDGFTVTFDSNSEIKVPPITGVKLYSTISPPENPITGYALEGWYLDDKTFTQQWDFAIDVVIGNITLYAKWGDFDGSLKLGDTGFGGGKIFYVADGKDGRLDGIPMADTYPVKKCYYLEAAPENCNGGNWSSGASGPGGDGTAIGIGTGRKNTDLILVTYTIAPAAQACRDYRGPNHKDDWFLPSKGELNQLYLNRTHVGLDTSTNNYWSSSEDSATNAWIQDFSDGTQGTRAKNNPSSVRAIRAF